MLKRLLTKGFPSSSSRPFSFNAVSKMFVSHGIPKDLKFSSRQVTVDIEKKIGNKRISKAKKYLDDKLDFTTNSIAFASQSHSICHLGVFDEQVKSERDSKLKEKKIRLMTGYKDSENLRKKDDDLTIENFLEIKQKILSLHPEYIKYDAEYYLSNAGEEERIEFIKERSLKSFNFRGYRAMDYDPDEDVLLVLSNEMIVNREMQSEIPKTSEEPNAVEKMMEKENKLFNQGEGDPEAEDLRGKLLATAMIDGVEEFTEEDCKLILSLLKRDINYIEAHISNCNWDFEHKLAIFRQICEEDYLTRAEEGDVDWNRTGLFREETKVLKQILESTYKPSFKARLNSYSKSLDNHRIDAGLILSRPPIFLYVPKNEVDYCIYKTDFEKKYGVNFEKLIVEFDAHNNNPHDVWREAEKAINNDPNNEPIIRKRRSYQKLTSLELSKLAETNYSYKNTYVLKDNLEEDPYDVYCLDSKHYLRVDPTIVDKTNIQTDSCWDVYFIYHNKHLNTWEFPTIQVTEGVSFKDSVEHLSRNIIRGGFDYLIPRDYPPLLQITRNFFKHEESDPKNEGLVGVRTYYYIGYHDVGEVSMSVNAKHDYDDFALVKKDELHKYFNKDYYKQIVKALH